MEGLKKLRSAARPPAIRYFGGHLKQPASGSDPFELQESDIWSADSTDPDPAASPRTPSSPTVVSGNPSLLRQRPAINPALSAVSGARAIPQLSSPPGRAGMSVPTRMSAPVNVPVWTHWKGRRSGELDDDYDEEKDDGDCGRAEYKMMPPHEIVARSHSTAAFSVFEGAGRTLKGRDLRRVRNAVFRKTGFLD